MTDIPLFGPDATVRTAERFKDVAAIMSLTPDDYVYRQAGNYLEALTGSASTPMTFQTYDPAHRNGSLNGVIHGTLRDVFPALFRLNMEGAAIAVAVNETDFKGRKKTNMLRVRAVFADEDVKCTIEPLVPPDFVVHGRDGRRHLYWLVENLGLDEFETFQNDGGLPRSMVSRYT